MRLIFRTLIFSAACFSSFLTKANYDYNQMVTLGADCSLSVQSGVAKSADPFESDFVEMVENGECSGVVYSDELMPRWAAEAIISVDPTSTYFIREDVFQLDPITVEALGDNKFSIPWYWFNTDNSDVEDFDADPQNPPMCTPEDPNNYQSFVEIG